MVRAEQSGGPRAAVLFTSNFTSNRVFPRVRRNPDPLTAALGAWLRSADVANRTDEDWLRPAAGG